MIPLYSIKQIRDADSFAIDRAGIPSILLMENASVSLLRHILHHAPGLNEDSLIAILCGRGNNAGDGFALARHFYLSGFKNLKIIHTAEASDLTEDASKNFSLLKNLDTEGRMLRHYTGPADISSLSSADMIIDALLGTGAKGELREPFAGIVRAANELDAFRVAVDIPTGLDADTGYTRLAFRAELTISLAELKRGLFVNSGPEYAGKVVKGYIGVGEHYFKSLRPEDWLIEASDARDGLPEKKKGVHKYSAGKVFIIAGSSLLPGAAVLASNAALASGAGSVMLGFPLSALHLAQQRLTEVIVKGYEDSNAGCLSSASKGLIEERVKWADVVAIGPGLGREDETLSEVRAIIGSLEGKRAVIDADALIALGNGAYKALPLKGLVLTPHSGEFASLLGITTEELMKDPIGYGRDFALQTGSYLVLKGAPTAIFSPDGNCFINTTGNPGMAKFGTGDALTGIIAGLLSQSREDVLPALISAVYLHSLSADMLLDRYSVYSINASLITENLGRAFIQLMKG